MARPTQGRKENLGSPAPTNYSVFLCPCGAHGASWGPTGNHQGLMEASLLNKEATMKPLWGPRDCKANTHQPQKNNFLCSAGPEVKFGQIAPSLGERKLHVPGWFLHRFGSILVGKKPDYDQIVENINIKSKKRLQGLFKGRVLTSLIIS